MNDHAHTLERSATNVQPGGWAVARGEPIATLLGSCVSVCLFDPRARIGGLNHFMLPSMGAGRSEVDVLLGGDYNMEALLNAMLQRGARKADLVAKAFGGGAVVAGLIGQSVGQRNASFAREWLDREQIPLLASDLAGMWSRKVVFDTRTGDVFCRRFSSHLAVAAEIAKREAAYQKSLSETPRKPGNVELF